MMDDESYVHPDGWMYQFRSSVDRRFWHCSPNLHFGIVDDYGNIVPSRPLNG